MQVEQISIEKLIPYVNNARTHSDAQVAQIAASIKEFGFNNPVLIADDNSIIAGHGRVMAARKLGKDTVPAVRLSHLTDTQRKAYVIADNQLAMNAGWNDELLTIELNELLADDFALELLGFDPEELKRLMGTELTEGLTDEDAVPDVSEEPVTKLGDVWLLGKHRVMCGDSTSIDAVDNLMNGGKADMVFTDPPYNVKMQRSASIRNDDLSDVDFEALLSGAFSCASMSAQESAPWFVWIGWRAWSTCERVLSNYKTVRNCIVWAKPSIGLGQPGYRYQHEVGLFCGEIEDRSASDLWTFSRDRAGLHPTMKPVELVEHGLQTAGMSGDVVLDLFGGSGSTLIACEKTNRQARLMELDPKYCDVIVKRWQDFTGKNATLEETGESFNELSDIKNARQAA
jgi:DNA modification methylase